MVGQGDDRGMEGGIRGMGRGGEVGKVGRLGTEPR